MKYDLDFKLKCVELYKNGQWIDTPVGIGQKNFRKRIVTWNKIYDLHGINGLSHPTTCKEYTTEQRYALVAKVLAGESQKNVAINEDSAIDPVFKDKYPNKLLKNNNTPYPAANSAVGA